MLPQRMRCCEITSSAIIGLKTLLQFPFHKHFERTWFVVLDMDSRLTYSTGTNSGVTCSKNTALYKLHAAARLSH